ncbi:MAG: 7-cyano-7-deazaguanine synthase [Planctomycetota bacterium]
MAHPPVAIMTGGGIHGLVAAAVAVDQRERDTDSFVLIHVADGRPAGERRLEAVRKQAEQLGDLPLLVHTAAGLAPPTSESTPNLTGPQRLLAAASLALSKGAQRLVWPVAVDGDEDRAALAAEQALLCQHLVLATAPSDAGAFRIDTPLLEIDDAQLIQLGEELGVDWGSAWSCRRGGESPCQACPGCDRRRQAFARARVVDPVDAARAVAAA